MTLIRTLRNFSHRIEVGIFAEESDRGRRPEVTILVPEDMVDVGGGTGSPFPGAFLYSAVASTDHTAENPHQLRGFAFGLKITGMSRADLFNAIKWRRPRSVLAPHPEAMAHAPGPSPWCRTPT